MKLAILTLAAAATLSTSAFAAVSVEGGVVNFTGEIVNTACTVTSDTADQTVKLGQYTVKSLTGTGNTAVVSNDKPFKIVLGGCNFDGAGLSAAPKAAITFNGTVANTENTALAVVSGTNQIAALGVGIQILDDKKVPVRVDGTTAALTKPISEEISTIYNFSARYIAMQGKPTAGAANASVNFTVTYE